MCYMTMRTASAEDLNMTRGWSVIFTDVVAAVTQEYASLSLTRACLKFHQGKFYDNSR